MTIELGSKVKDSVTGYKGIATAMCKYLNGCVQYQVEANDPTKEVWIDEGRLIIEIPRFICIQCGKELRTESGLKTHKYYCERRPLRSGLIGGGRRSHP